MAQLDWGLLNTDPLAAQQRGFNYAEQVRQAAANRAAGQQYATGDYSGASQTLARSGDIGNAQKLRMEGQQTNSAGLQYVAKALPVLETIQRSHANDPDGGKQALSNAFDQIAPEAMAATGATPQALATFKNALVADPQGTIARLRAQLPIQYQNVDGTLYGVQGMQATQIAQQPKFTTQAYGTSLVPTNQAAADAVNAPQTQQLPGSPVTAPTSPPQGAQIISRADPAAMHAVESGNNPAAVSPKGAQGTAQVMPATAANPGFGVAPADPAKLADPAQRDAELQRVGDQTLAAYTNHYGSPVLGHIAYNMGPGATDTWIAGGAKFSTLPKETQDYLGRIALAQAQPQIQARQGQGAPVQGQGGPARIGQPIGGGPAPLDNEAIKNDVRIWLASKGTINPQYGMGQLGAAQRMVFDQQKNALMKELNVTPEDVASGQAIRKADQKSLGALQTQADQIKAFEGTAKRNADLALSLLDKGGPQGQSPIINKWTQEWRKWVSGDTNVSQFTASLGTFADEYAKVVAGQNGSTDAVRSAAYSRINEAMNKQTIRDVIGVMKNEMENRRIANDDQLGEIKQRLGAPQASNPTPAQPAGNGPKIRVYNPKTQKLE